MGLDFCIFMLIKIKYFSIKFCRLSLSIFLILCNFLVLIYFIIVKSKNGLLKSGGSIIFLWISVFMLMLFFFFRE